ncbi:hypothetical protein CQA57_07025 [Helicobacter anseris]|uniref:Uncharacterized protein n=1 Tax=Helicobacter anseris TaxID=375926 RepID=A0A3D8J4E7_9HELI|nr:hypothetical protein [Helicobacter anseris]RDU72348.1 hypothetical protein CQA57_07025 [Helicobacter anseris]
MKVKKEKFNAMSLEEQIDFLHSVPVTFWICWDCYAPDLLILDYNSKYELKIKSRISQEWFEIDRLEYLGDGKFVAHSGDISFSFIPYYAVKSFYGGYR